jgi:amidase
VPLGPAGDVALAELTLAWSTGEPGWEPEPVIRAAVEATVDRLTAAGLRPAAEPRAVLDLDEALDVTQRYWRRVSLSGAEADRQLRDWDRYARRRLTALDGIDVVVLPAAREPAPAHRPLEGTDYVYTLPASLTGWPAAVVPVGWHEGLPVAVQVLARSWRDDVAAAVAAALVPTG